MGHKVHPTGFRIGVIRDWQAKWYADKHYAEFLQEDLKLREGIQKRYAEAAVSQVEIERQANKVSITIYTARPGIVIGRGGQRVDETRAYLEKLVGKKVQLNIQEIQRPELDAYLVAKQVAEQIERRIAFRRAMKQTLLRTMQAGAKGMKVSCAGRLGGAEIARRLTMHEGQVPLHTLRADIDYGFIEAKTTMGRIGVKVWIYKGDILPEAKEDELEEGILESIGEVETGIEESVAEAEPVVETPAVEEIVEEPAPEAEAEVEEKQEEPVAEDEPVAEMPPAGEKVEEPAPEAEAEVKGEEPAAEAEPLTEEKAEEPVADVEPVAVEEVKAEEKPAKPAARRRKKATKEETQEKTEEEPAAEEKPAKPATKRKTRAKAEPKKEKIEEPVAEPESAEEEENSAAT
ncbi:MAG: 30S ribosomal protein S3 [Dehalococcoidales bacterium]|nr:MAG: 30S ribosomal protein S3 [Dehalococcoidales bacterium]